MVAATPEHGLALQWRDTEGETGSIPVEGVGTPAGGVGAPVWVKLVRSNGSEFQGILQHGRRQLDPDRQQ